MGWTSAIKERRPAKQTEPSGPIAPPVFETEPVDWDRLVTLDFETYYDDDYTLRKLSTSEYIRDKRFKAQMVGIKIGRSATKVYPAAKVRAALTSIVWQTHSLLAHHAQFDGFILSHHYGIKPKKIYDTLSMARALHSQDIGAGLDEVSVFYGGGGKLHGILDKTKGVRSWSKELVKETSPYCANDVDETLRVFKLMLPKLPRTEIDLIDLTCKMFTDPVLKVDLPRVQKELERELAERRKLLLSVVEQQGSGPVVRTKAELREFPDASDEDILIARAKKIIGSSEKFADLLRAEGVEPPVKLSAAWLKKSPAERTQKDKWGYAFAQTDLAFQDLLESDDPRVKALAEARVSVKSPGNAARAQRFLDAGAGGAPLPVYLKYAAAHTMRWGGGNKMNMQNLTRGGELRRSIMAPKGHQVCVADSGQIEARVNAWLWGQDDLLEGFRLADQGLDRDVYCKFADSIYGREIDKEKDPTERFVGKVGILGLGYQMGAERLQRTLALGTMGPKVYLDLPTCVKIVGAYRARNRFISGGWNRCQQIIEDMAAGRSGSWKCISWEHETIHLPNGMRLKYPGLTNKAIAAQVAHAMDPENNPKPVGDEWVYRRKGQEQKIYGGLLCENLVQSLARIIIAEQMLAIAKKARVVTTTHDEVVTIAKTAQAPKVFDLMVTEMSRAPAWCRDLPLSAEGGFDAIYSK